jgi:hypothetical protein
MLYFKGSQIKTDNMPQVGEEVRVIGEDSKGNFILAGYEYTKENKLQLFSPRCFTKHFFRNDLTFELAMTVLYLEECEKQFNYKR